MLFSSDCSLKMLFPFVWILLLSSTSLQSLGRFYEPPGISPGRVETSIRRGGQLRCSCVANLLQYLRAKNYQNIMVWLWVSQHTEDDQSGGETLLENARGWVRRQSSLGGWTSDFAVAGPPMFNTLPDDLRDPAVSTSTFGQSLKTHLFSAYQHV